MATTTSDKLAESIDAVIRNPNAMQRISLDLVEALTNGETIIVDPSNPFVYVQGIAATMTAVGLDRNEAAARKLYPSMAQTEDDIYRHMATPDFLNRFAKPGSATLGLVMNLTDVLGRAVPVDDGTGARAIIIPKHTQIQKDNIYFTLQYPLVIKVLYNETLSIYFDNRESLLNYTLPTNSVSWRVATIDNRDILLIDVPMQAVRISSQIIQLTSFTGFNRNITFEDNFHYARAFIRDRTTSNWKEIEVTHTKQIFDSKKPTICLRVLNNSVDVYIPQIYFQNGLIQDAVRLDIYTTLGPIDMDLTELGGDNLKVRFDDLDYNELQKFSAPLDAFTMFAAFIRSRISGGSNAVTFMELRRRVVNRSTVTAGLPITTNQMGSAMYDMGFQMGTTLDNITDRQYTAIRAVEPPDNGTTVTGLGCSIQLVNITLQDIIDSKMVADTPNRLVITPGTLFKNVGGYIRIVGADEYKDLQDTAQASPDGIANIVNSTQFYYTPFHYVLDTTNELFTVRPYQLNDPAVEGSAIYQQNDSLGLDLRTETYSIGMNPDGSGYSILATMTANLSLKMLPIDRISAQLSYVPKDSTKRTWVSGEFISAVDPNSGRPVDDKWIFRFNLDTNFDVNSNHQLSMTETGYPVELVHDFDILYVVKNFAPLNSQPSDIDTIISKDHIVDFDYLSTYYGATQEKLTIEFGKFLKHLWRRSRTVYETVEYLTYEEDVPAFYTQDIYARDENGHVIVKYNYDTSEISYDILFKKGDPIIDADGKPVLKHAKGDYVLGPNQEPIPKQSDRALDRELDLFLVDGRYFFATNDETVDYLKESLAQIVSWITEDIAHLSQRCLERTDLFYYPKSSVGLIDVIVGDGTRVRLPADQKFTVKYTVRKEKYNNAEIRDSLRESAAKTILSAMTSLQQVTGGAITRNDILNTIKSLHRDDIIDVAVSGFLDDRYSAALITDMSSIPTIGKKLVTMSNLTLQVQDDVTVEWEILDTDNQTSRYSSRKEQ